MTIPTQSEFARRVELAEASIMIGSSAESELENLQDVTPTQEDRERARRLHNAVNRCMVALDTIRAYDFPYFKQQAESILNTPDRAESLTLVLEAKARELTNRDSHGTIVITGTATGCVTQ